MKTPPRLTKESEQRISAALVEVANMTNQGMHPNDAIEKVAAEKRIPGGQVQLMVRAFNNGQTLGHFRAHDELQEKAASFPLADADVIMEKLFPSEVKTAAAKLHETMVSGDYQMSPRGWMQRRKAAAAAEKAVSLREKMAAVEKVAYPRDTRRADRQAATSLQDVRRGIEAAKLAAINASYDAMHAVDALTNHFRAPGTLPVHGVMKRASAVLGPRAERLLQRVAAHKFVKESQDVEHDVDWDAAPYSLVKAALDAFDRFTEAHKNYLKVEEAAPEKRAEILRPFGQTSGVITGSAWDGQSLTKEAVGAAGLVAAGAIGGTARGLASTFAPKSIESMVQDELAELGSPEHEDKLRAIRAQTMIHELMSSDSVIGGYPYEDVLDAYNHLAEVAPRSMQHSVMAQALLRKYLEQAQAIGPFDVDQMLDVEHKITQRDRPGDLVDAFGVGDVRSMGPPNIRPKGVQLQPEATTAKTLGGEIASAARSAGSAAKAVPLPQKFPFEDRILDKLFKQKTQTRPRPQPQQP